MKKSISILMSILMLVMFTITGCAAEQNENIIAANEENITLSLQIDNPIMTINGAETEIDSGRGTVPVIVNDRTLVPVRAIIEAVGGSTEWVAEENTAVLTYNNDEIRLTIDSTNALLNGEENTLDVAPQIINDRTMLPIRFIAESFNFKVDWNGDTKTITIIGNKSQGENNTATMPSDSEKTDSKVLIAYFSRAGENYGVGVIEKGNTEIIAEMIAEETGGDLFKIERETPYPTEYEACTEEAQAEQRENARPKLKNTLENLDDYDVIYIGMPVWWSDMPMPVYTFVESLDFSGKTIYPFTTHAGSGLSGIPDTLSNLCKGADIKDGFAISGTTAQNDRERAKSELLEWLKN